MSNQTNNGGPAFPVSFAIASKRGPTHDALPSGGMTLRDYFATHAPAPPLWWVAQYGDTRTLMEHGRLIADWNWTYADAMLAARGDV
jgi:hypothetical protein